MRHLCWLPLAALLFASSAHAQRAHNCPTLPSGSGLSWDVVEGPDFLYCKAMRATGDDDQAFAVMLREEATFKPNRSMREERGLIDGREVRWYRSEIATHTGLVVRETVVELSRDMTAHIVVRAFDEEQLVQVRMQAEALRFDDLRIGRN